MHVLNSVCCQFCGKCSWLYVPDSSWQTNIGTCLGGQETSLLLWNANVHYRAHNSSPLYPIPRQTNPVHTLPPYPFNIPFNIITFLGISFNFYCPYHPKTGLIFYITYSCYMLRLCHLPRLWLLAAFTSYRARRVIECSDDVRTCPRCESITSRHVTYRKLDTPPSCRVIL